MLSKEEIELLELGSVWGSAHERGNSVSKAADLLLSRLEKDDAFRRDN